MTPEHKAALKAGREKALAARQAAGIKHPEFTADHREKLSQAARKPKSDATRAAMSESRKRWWAAKKAAQTT